MKKKVRVTLPKKAHGGPIWDNEPRQAPYTGPFSLSEDFGVPNIEVNRTLKPTSREHANLEAEKGETVVTNLDPANSGGIPEFYTVGGKRHYDGGTPLNLPPDSFVFSRDRKMRLKDKEILAQFGKNVGKKGKKGYTFAEISKQYDINPFRKILADPTSDKHQIDTAQKMIENYNLKLGGLAMVQESMKGFPDGIPGIAMPYLEHVGMDPSQFFPQGQPPQAPQGQMQYGGTLPTFPTAQHYLDYHAGSIDAFGNPTVNPTVARKRVTGLGSTEDYFNAVRDQQRFDFNYRREPGAIPEEYTETWSIPQHRTPIVPPAKPAGPTISNVQANTDSIPQYGEGPILKKRPVLGSLQRGGPNNNYFDPNNPVNIESQILTPGTQNVNPNVLTPRQTDLTAKYSYLADYTPKYDKTGTKIVYGADDSIYKKKTGLSSELLDIRREMAKTYDLPTTAQGVPDYTQMDPNVVLDKSKMDPKTLQRMYDIMYEKRAIRDAEGFQRKQYYGDVEAEQRGFSAETPLEELDLGIRFATGVQSRQLQELEAQKKADQLASLNLQYGGQLPKYQFQGEVPPSEADYTTGFNQSNFDPWVSYGPTAYVNAPEPQMPANIDQYYNPQQNLQPRKGESVTDYETRVGIMSDPTDMSYYNKVWDGQKWVATGTTPTTTKKATRSQNVPKDAVRWDMSLDGYEESDVQAGDYVKKKDGKWYKVTGYSTKNTAYTGDFHDPRLVGKLHDNNQYFGRLKQRIDENPELRDAIVKKYKANVKKLKPGKNLTEGDIAVARGLTEDQIIDNFYEAQMQIMSVHAHKGDLNDKAGIWDKDRNQYINTITELDFDPMTTGETAAFQTTYIGLQELQKDPKFKEDLEDFALTPWGKEDEPRGRISDVDGWMGNTTIGQAAMYQPRAKQLEMEEAEWNKAAKELKHLGLGAPGQKTPFWTEDIMNLGFAARNLFSIQREKPWVPIPGVKLPRATFMSPDQQIQNILGAAGKAADVAGAFGTPQAYMANVAKSQANAMRQVANAIGTVQDRNVQVANQFERQRAQILNQANDRRARLAMSLHDKNAILNQQFTNDKNQAWQQVNKNLVNMWTNRGMTQNLNTLTDQYNIDPVTGYKYFTSPRPLTPKNAQQPDVAGQINNLVAAVPGLTPDQAARIITKGAGDPAWSPTQQTGIDPTQTSPSYPGGASAGYYPQG